MNTDQIGQFPAKSIANNNYIMIVYAHDTNTTLLCHMKTKNVSEFQNINKKICTRLTKQGHKFIFYYIDNKLSNQTKIMLE